MTDSVLLLKAKIKTEGLIDTGWAQSWTLLGLDTKRLDPNVFPCHCTYDVIQRFNQEINKDILPGEFQPQYECHIINAMKLHLTVWY